MMQSSTAPAGRVELPGSAPAYFLWEIPEKRVSVRFSLDLVERLERDVLESFRAITQRGSEIGGLLLGTVEPGSGAHTVIDDYELVTCDYSRGPLFLLSEEEKARLAEAVRRRRTGLSLAGFFRSNTRKDLSLDEDDVALFTQYFAGPENVFLLIKPFATKASLAAPFLWDDGRVRAESSYRTFPFRRSELLKGEFARLLVTGVGPKEKPAEAAAPAPAAPHKPASRVLPFVVKRDEEPAAAPERKIPADPGPPPIFRKLTEEAPPPAVARREEKPAAPPAVKSEPAIQTEPAIKPEPTVKTEPAPKAQAPVQTEPPGPAAPAKPVAQMLEPPAFAAAPAANLAQPSLFSGKKLWALFGGLAMLALAGGTFLYLKSKPVSPAGIAAVDKSGLQLKAEQNSGQLLVSWNRDAEVIRSAQKAILTITDGAQSEDVQLDLAQLRGGSITYKPVTADVSFRLEVMDAKYGKSRNEYIRVLRPVGDAQAAPPAPSSPGEEAGAPPQNAAGSAQADAVVTQPVPGQTPPPPTKPFSLASRIRPAEPQAALPEPPRVEGGPAADRPVVASPAVAAPPPEPPASKPQAQAPPPQTPPAPAQTPAASPAPSKSRVGGQVVEAKLLRKVEPIFPPMARQARVNGTVRVRASIGKDGHIKRVEVLNGHPLLRQAAIDAVQKWIYNPSLLNGEPIDSTTEVDLNFNLGGYR